MVSDLVTHPGDLAPCDVGTGILYLLLKIFASFAYDLDVSDECVLKHRV